MPDYSFETELGARDNRQIVGLDEAGRGPWAGPVVAAAVCISPADLAEPSLQHLNDSKKLTAQRRASLCTAIQERCRFGIGQASVSEIDQFNILQASLLAMQRAVAAMDFVPDGAIVDGLHAPELPCPHRAMARGDSLSISVAAASILAKVTRDRLMERLDQDCPGYHWNRNRGYGTADHRKALEQLGPSRYHRRSFRPIQELVSRLENKTVTS